jgi:hypothetical protein
LGASPRFAALKRQQAASQKGSLPWRHGMIAQASTARPHVSLTALDAKGNVHTAEVDSAKRIRKFKLTSDALK